eukprot:gb/GECH01012566.1/.p1 GENE.gb/GECH01012566.1/~~gb/GECH01012566.1/.p1  ORF type:complete len:515 (+),score=112.98 gb/GECH01012566.1/:1-1545(+)
MAERQRYIEILSNFSSDIQVNRSVSGRKSKSNESIDPEWFNGMVRKLDSNLASKKTSPVKTQTIQDMIQFIHDYKVNPHSFHIALLLSLISREPENANKVHQKGGISLAAQMLGEDDLVLQRNCMALLASISGHSDYYEHIKEDAKKSSVLNPVINACSFVKETDKPSSEQNGIIANACSVFMNLITEKDYDDMIKHLKQFEVIPILLYAFKNCEEDYVHNKALHLASVFTSDSEYRKLFMDNGILDQVIEFIMNDKTPDFVLGPATFCVSKYGVDENLASKIIGDDKLLRRFVNILKLCDAERGGERGLYGRDPKKSKPSADSKRVNSRLAFTVCTALSNLLSGSDDNTVKRLDELGFANMLINMLKNQESEDSHILASRGLSNMFTKVTEDYAPTLFTKALKEKVLSKFTQLAAARKEKPDGVFFTILRAINVFCNGIKEKGNEDNISQVKETVEKDDDLKQLMMIIAEIEKSNEQSESKAPFKTILILVMILFLFLLFVPVAFKFLKNNTN